MMIFGQIDPKMMQNQEIYSCKCPAFWVGKKIQLNCQKLGEEIRMGREQKGKKKKGKKKKGKEKK